MSDNENALVTHADKDVGELAVYHRGVDALGQFPTARRTTAQPVGGRPATSFTIPPVGAGNPGSIGLAWTYDDGHVAMVTADSGAMSGADLRWIAEGLRRGAARPAEVAFHLGYVPPGFSMSETVRGTSGGEVSSVVLVTAKSAAAIMASPARVVPPGRDAQPTAISLMKANPSLWAGHSRPTGLACYEDLPCLLPVDGGRYVLEMDVAESMTRTQVRKTLESIRVADVTNPKSWYGVNQAVPVSAQVTGQD